MILLENLLLALQSLKANPLRSILTLIGIAVGIGAVLYVVVLGEITQRSIKERLESMGSNVLMIRQLLELPCVNEISIILMMM